MDVPEALSAEHRDLLLELSLLISQQRGVDDLFASFAAHVRHGVTFDFASLFVTTNDPRYIRSVGNLPLLWEEAASGTIHRSDAMGMDRMAGTGDGTEYIPKRLDIPSSRALAEHGFERAWVTLLEAGGKPYGMLTVAKYAKGPFPPEHVAFLKTAAHLLAQAVRQDLELERARLIAARAEAASNLILALQANEPFDSIFQRLPTLLEGSLRADYVGLVAREAEGFAVRAEEPAGMHAQLPPGRATDELVTRLATQGEFQQFRVEGYWARPLASEGHQRGALAFLRDGEELLGVLVLARKSSRRFDSDERQFIELLGSILSQSLTNQRRIERTETAAVRARTLNEVAVLLNAGETIETIFHRLRELLLQGVGFDFCALTVRGGDGDTFRSMRSEPLPGDTAENSPIGDAEIRAVLSAGAFSAQYGREAIPFGARAGIFDLGIERAASFVLTTGAEPGGLLTIGRKAPSPFTDTEMAFFQVVASLLANAAANERRLALTEAEAEDQAIIAAAAAAAAREINALDIVLALREAVSRFIARPFVNFGYLDGDACVFPSSSGKPRRVPYGPRFVDALRDGQATVPAEGRRTDEWDAEPTRIGLQAHIATRATSGGSVAGLLVVGSRDPAFKPGERELRLCRLIADIVGPAMANSRAIEREREEAEEQRLIAEVAAVAARAAEPGELIGELQATVRGIIPKSFLAFGFIEGEEIVFPLPGGALSRFPLDEPSRRTAELGQIVWPGVPSGLNDITEVRALGIQSICSTAVLSGGATVGVLLIGSRVKGYQFEERELRIFRLIAQIVGPAMENARASLRARLDAEEQRTLAEAAAALAAGTSESGIVESLRDSVQRFMPGAVVSVFFIAEGNEVTGPDGIGGPMGPQLRAALASGQNLVRKPWPELGERSAAILEAGRIEQFVMTALSAAGEQQGVLFTGLTDAETAVDERHLRLLRLIGNMAGPAFANARESARRQQEAEEQRLLAAAAAALAAGSTEQAILDGIVAPIRGFIPGARVTFNYIEGDEVVLYTGEHRRRIHDLSRAAIESGQVEGETETSPMTETSRDLMRSFGVTRFLETVATSAGTQIGLLFVGTTDSDYRFSERDRRILRLIADITGPAMANAREDRRRREEAEDERMLSEVAAVAARATSNLEITRAIPAAVAPLIPGAFANYGRLDGDTIVFPVIREGVRRTLGADEVTLPMTAAGRQARAYGQAVGTPEDLDEQPAAALGTLQHYALTTYFSGGTPSGVLAVSTTDPDYRFSERALALLKRMVQFVGPAVEAARAEAELARQTALYSLILRSLSEGVVLSDINGQVMFANELGRRILRALDPSGAATGWSDVTPRLPEQSRAGFQAVFREGSGSRGRAPLAMDGRSTWFDYEIVPLNDPVMKVLFVFADVTADVEREEEQTRHRQELEQTSRLAALGELIGGVAHELNNPLTAILGFAEVMSLSPEAAPLAEELGIVQKEALRARNIVRDLLFIVKPGTAERSVIPVTDLVAHIERLRRAAWVQQGIGWDISIEQPCSVWGNEHQLTQVILNLVTNAEHALAGRPQRHISIRAACHSGRTEISVSDTGAGMDEATRGRVFEPFFTTKHGIGTGLGLPLSYSIVQSHEGEIRVESEPGVGSTFTVSLPPGAPETPAAPPAGAAPAASGAIRVLVVDDEPSLRKVCQRLITSMGHECATAENSAAAVELASHAEFDVVLCDYRLASETANDVVAGFERVAPRLVSRMVIATGATTDAGVIELTEKHGMRLMAKPYGVDELADMIKEVGGSAD